MPKKISTIMIEAIVVGVLLVFLFLLVDKIIPKAPKTALLFITGALFHIICEISGVNIWYVKEYAKLL